LLAEIEAGALVPDPEPPPPPPPVPGDLETGLPLERIYAQANVSPSPYSAEMLLRVAKNLQAMPLEQARAAVEAMDAADDRWTVGDVLLDAQRKCAALRSVQQSMVGRAERAQVVYEATVQTIDQQLQMTVDEIQKQIDELTALLREARETGSVEKAGALSELEATRNAAAAENARLDAAVADLEQVFEFFGEPPP
jgi:hypothetical protein